MTLQEKIKGFSKHSLLGRESEFRRGVIVVGREGMPGSQPHICEWNLMKGKGLTCVRAYERRYILVVHKNTYLPLPIPSLPPNPWAPKHDLKLLQKLSIIPSVPPSPHYIYSSTAVIHSPFWPISLEPPSKKERKKIKKRGRPLKFLTCQ